MGGMKSEIELQAEAGRIRKQLDRIEASRRRKENRKYLGKCFKYRNTFGRPEESWWLYLKITKVGVSMSGHKFQKMHDGRFEALNENYVTGLHGWIEIPRAEFNRQWMKFCADMKRLGV